MSEQRVGAFTKELDELKETLQDSLVKFREVRKELRTKDVKEDVFQYRRLIQLESEYLRKFEKEISEMNLLVQKRLVLTESLFEELKDDQSIMEIRKRLKQLQNAFDSSSPILGEALEKMSKKKNETSQALEVVAQSD